MSIMGILTDTTRCIGCEECVAACKKTTRSVYVRIRGGGLSLQHSQPKKGFASAAIAAIFATKGEICRDEPWLVHAHNEYRTYQNVSIAAAHQATLVVCHCRRH